MARESMREMLRVARREKGAIGAFNILDYNSFKAVVAAADEMGQPVIVQTSVKTVLHWGFEILGKWYRELAGSTPVAVAMHLDHCKDLDIIKQCIRNGWTSVMIDASDLPFEENLRLSAEVVKMAHPKGVSVEAELGEIGGVEDDLKVDPESARLADPEKALAFVGEVPVDCLAPAIGTAHGVYKGTPKIDFDRLASIGNSCEVPLALHGGTGLADEVFKKSISMGVAKINISTQLKHAFIDAFVAHHEGNPAEYNPLKVLQAQYLAIKEATMEKVSFFSNQSESRK